MSRREKRKEVKKLKRQRLRREAALVGDEGEEEARIPEDDEERQKAEHDEQERLWLLREEEARVEWLRRQEEEAERKRQEEERSRKGVDGEEDLEEGWEYVEDGPAEIIWKGNEIIVKKPRKKVRKGTNSCVLAVEEKNGLSGEYSNPLPPQSTAFSSYQANTEDVADQSTNFGTEQDKTNCPFYIKQGVCRFGVRCSRLHPVFNDARTLLMRSMYTGSGLALEPVESLESCLTIYFLKAPMYLHTSCTSRRDGQMLRWSHEKEAAVSYEEVVQEFEEFYDDVHSEFLQFGEIVNFKVCRNSSPHLRGNVYVHYLTRESAVAAYNHMNGRFYAKKQISCEFVGVTRWKLAICGEFMRTNYKTCSRGTACNFLHCFENPRREYEWADVDRAPPRFWRRTMATLFGNAPLSGDDLEEKPRPHIEDNERRRHRDDRELTYGDDRRKDKHSRETDQGRGRGDRHRNSYEDETNDRIRSGSKSRHSKEGTSRRDSTHDEDGHHSHRRRRDFTDDEDDHHIQRQRRDSTHDQDGHHSHRRRRDSTNEEGDHHSHRRRRDSDDPARDRSTSHSRYGDDQGSINDERWSPGDDRELSYSKDRRRDRRQREPTHDADDEDADYDHHSHRRSHHHRSRRRSRSPGSHKTRTSSRSTSQKARSQDGLSSSDEQEYLRPSIKESKRHRPGSHTSVDGREDRNGQRHQKRRRSDRERSESEHRQSVRVRDSDILEPVVAGLVSDENRLRELETDSVFKAGESLNQEAETSNNSTLTGLSLELNPTDEVQKSTSQWQSWRKTKSKKAKLGLKDAARRFII